MLFSIYIIYTYKTINSNYLIFIIKTNIIIYLIDTINIFNDKFLLKSF